MAAKFRAMPWVLAFALVMYPALAGIQQACGAEKVEKTVPLKSGHLEGAVSDTTGAAVQKAAVQLINKDGKVVAKAETSKTGGFKLKSVDAGKYKLLIGKKISLDIVVADDSEISKLIVLAPNDGVYSAGALPTWAWIAIGVGVAAAIAIPLALSDGGGRRRTVAVTPAPASP